jgi:predicted house-cleaning NTP pyrophosphatase (Maf/HAM1 superfamily)
VALFESMSGDDHTGIIGLPLTRVVTLLGRHGIHVLQQ